jgi:hypothetical protein
MKKKRIVAFGPFDKPAHSVYHILLSRDLSSIAGIIREQYNIL